MLRCDPGLDPGEPRSTHRRLSAASAGLRPSRLARDRVRGSHLRMRRAGLAAPALTSPAHPLNPARMDGRRLLRHRTGTLALDGRTLVMGVVNVTPDSFSDGGVHFRAEDAVAGALRLAAEGADILDIGGEFDAAGLQRDIARGGMAAACGRCSRGWRARRRRCRRCRSTPPRPRSRAARSPPAPRSSTTSGASSATRTLAAVVAEAGAAAVVMHNRERRDDAIDIVDDMLRFFERSLGLARARRRAG